MELGIRRHLMRSAGSVGANYIEANEALNHKHFVMRIKIRKKEAIETRYWLELNIPTNENSTSIRNDGRMNQFLHNAFSNLTDKQGLKLNF